MKLSHFYCFLFSSLFFFPVKSNAITPANNDDHTGPMLYLSHPSQDKNLTTKKIKSFNKEERTRERTERRIEKIKKLLNSQSGQKDSGIFNDSVGKWFWIWLISWGLGILLFVISNGSIGVFLAVIMLLAFVVGSISLVVWLKKQFG